MRIIYHHRTLGDGAEGIHIQEMIDAFRALGHRVAVTGPAGEPSQKRETRGGNRNLLLIKIKEKLKSFGYEFLELAYAPLCCLKLIRACQTLSPDFIYDRYITFNFGPVLAGMLCRVPVCLEVNAPLALERSSQKDESLRLQRIAFGLERWICSHAEIAVAVSTPLRNYLVGQGVPKEKILVMPNGTNPEMFFPTEGNPALASKLNIPENSAVIGFSGILRSWHGLDMLFQATGKLLQKGLNVFLLIVGDGPARSELEALAKELGIEGRYCISGRIPYSEVPNYVNLFDVAVSTKSTFYASPMKVLEYMALSLPVVVPDSPNFLDFVEPDVTSYVFRDGDLEDLVSVLNRIVRHPHDAEKIGRNARKIVEERLNWKWNARRICDYISNERS